MCVCIFCVCLLWGRLPDFLPENRGDQNRSVSLFLCSLCRERWVFPCNMPSSGGGEDWKLRRYKRWGDVCGGKKWLRKEQYYRTRMTGVRAENEESERWHDWRVDETDRKERTKGSEMWYRKKKNRQSRKWTEQMIIGGWGDEKERHVRWTDEGIGKKVIKSDDLIASIVSMEQTWWEDNKAFDFNWLCKQFPLCFLCFLHKTRTHMHCWSAPCYCYHAFPTLCDSSFKKEVLYGPLC